MAAITKAEKGVKVDAKRGRALLIARKKAAR